MDGESVTDREPDGDRLRAGERVTHGDGEGEGDCDDDIESDVCADCVLVERAELVARGLGGEAPVPVARADGGPEFVDVRDGGGEIDTDGDGARERESAPVDVSEGEARDDDEPPPPRRADADGFADTDERAESDVLERGDTEKLDDDVTEWEVRGDADADLHGALLREAAGETLSRALALPVRDTREVGVPETDRTGPALFERVAVGDGDADGERECDAQPDAVGEVDSVLVLRTVGVVKAVEDGCRDAEGECDTERLSCVVAECDVDAVSELLDVDVRESRAERELVDDAEADPERVGVDVADGVRRAERVTDGVDDREIVFLGVDVAVREEVVVFDSRADADDDADAERVFEAVTDDVDVFVDGVDADARADAVDVREARADVVGGADRVAVNVAVVVFVPVVDAVDVRDALELKVGSTAPASPRTPVKQKHKVSVNPSPRSITHATPSLQILSAAEARSGFDGRVGVWRGSRAM